ncbi:MAG: hypothetical protein AAF322_15615, partial [Pseudomonadota bacterium]
MRLNEVESFEDRLKRRQERLAREGAVRFVVDERPRRSKPKGGFWRFVFRSATYLVVVSAFGAAGFTILWPEDSSKSPLAAFERIRNEVASAAAGADQLNETFRTAMNALANPEESFGGLARPHRTAPETPSSTGVSTTSIGLSYGASVVLSAEGPRRLEDVAPTLGVAAPTKTVSIARTEGCALRRPKSDQTFAGVRLATSSGPVVAHVFSEKRRLRALHTMLKAARAEGVGSKDFKRTNGAARVVEVLLTDRTGPLYLALQSSRAVVWRLHIAEGVRVAHVALVSQEAAGVVGAPPGAMVEAIAAPEHMTIRGWDKPQRNALACAAHPYRKPDETWGAWDGAQRSAGVDRNTVAKSDLGHRYFGDW